MTKSKIATSVGQAFSLSGLIGLVRAVFPAKTKKYNYFVTYRFPEGYGRCGIERIEKVRNIEDIEEMERLIRRKNNNNQVTVESWQLFEKP